ncbi:MAG: 4-(cytidine 5'-diphospho)-2-C-methyl-D-erythritol kinase [Candidatus Omnitrophota bacterium]
MERLVVQSPAKLNLYLRVVGRLPGGYHRLITLFHRISLVDRLVLSKHARGFRLRTSHPSLETGESNIVTRAYRLLEKKYPGLPGVDVFLDKRIPLQAGLGGGSSNAAFFLLGMKRLLGLPLGLRELARMGDTLGSDVGFFLHEVNQAVGEGRGEKIRPLPFRGERWFVVALAEQGLSTPAVYREVRLPRRGASLTTHRRVARIAFERLAEKNVIACTEGLYNDLEGPAIRLRPEIQKTMALMFQLGAPAVAMSGSGPTVFAMWDYRKEAQTFAKKLRGFVAPARIRVCHTC